uniref:Roadblock/LAMTOR2 domain-containing protein n=1 Tax=Acrobeloides nanus TaxID=290746 RepID=A0A914CNZ8_9BILA
MLKTRALEKFLDQANTSGVNGIMLFNREGLTVARSGSRSINGSVYAALMSNIWETFERQVFEVYIDL